MKKNTVIIAIVLVVVMALYFYFKKKKATTEATSIPALEKIVAEAPVFTDRLTAAKSIANSMKAAAWVPSSGVSPNMRKITISSSINPNTDDDKQGFMTLENFQKVFDILTADKVRAFLADNPNIQYSNKLTYNQTVNIRVL